MIVALSLCGYCDGYAKTDKDAALYAANAHIHHACVFRHLSAAVCPYCQRRDKLIAAVNVPDAEVGAKV